MSSPSNPVYCVPTEGVVWCARKALLYLRGFRMHTLLKAEFFESPTSDVLWCRFPPRTFEQKPPQHLGIRLHALTGPGPEMAPYLAYGCSCMSNVIAPIGAPAE